ncbi:beta-galactoside-binding lectin-like [Brienomyrus brachyistius]|uniref:beta-galactoside-binding lectin-like n=1 Tax=Brienomyrus brachyistius TaxID=42636 RepID=UPI0020B1C9CE|nr:beta-galactoside-binding lectin-like [Brienomyrus brachyistius]
MNLRVTDMPVTTTNKLKITAIPKLHARRFVISMGEQEKKIALNCDVRFDYNGDYHIIVFNSTGYDCGCNETRETHFFFQEGKEFQITITFNSEEFHVKIPDDYDVSFPNSAGGDALKFIQVQGDMIIKSFKIE